MKSSIRSGTMTQEDQDQIGVQETTNDLFRLEIHHLSKTYDGRRWAVHDLSLQVRAGEIVGLIGPNGSGKTTTLNIIVGLRRPSRGKVLIHGADIEHRPLPAKQLLGYAPDDMNLAPNLTGWEYVLLTSALYGLPARLVQGYAEQLFEVFGMTPFRHQPVESYSHGMLKKTQLIATLAHAPQLFVLDEPLSGLDIESILLFKRLMLKLKARSASFLIATHQLELATELCDRVYMLREGQCIACGSPAAIMKDQCATTLEEAFIKLAAAHIPNEIVLNEIADRF